VHIGMVVLLFTQYLRRYFVSGVAFPLSKYAVKPYLTFQLAKRAVLAVFQFARWSKWSCAPYQQLVLLPF